LIGNQPVFAVIPARRGSKGVPRKNTRSLLGKPLVAWTLEQALGARCIDRIIVTTDDDDVAAIALQYGVEVPFMRPPELATDEAPTIDAVLHALDFYRSEAAQPEYVVLLEPTSPVRAETDIDAVVRSIHRQRDRFDAIVTVGEVREHPSIVKRIIGDRLVPFCPELRNGGRRQDNEPAYFPFGVAYAAKTAVLRSERTFYPARCTYFALQRYQHHEIDDLWDFQLAETLMQRVSATR
jgi:CMP-N,N'-diacetyllegionaminic acid synthase